MLLTLRTPFAGSFTSTFEAHLATSAVNAFV